MTSDIEQVVFQSITDAPALQAFVSKAGPELIERALMEGDQLYEQVNELDKIVKNDPLEVQVYRSHAVGYQAKHLVVLYRDIFFEIQRAQLLHAEGKVTQDQLQQLVQESKSTIIQASEALDKDMAEGLKNNDARHLVKQDHPWPIYKSQLEEINNHFTALEENVEKLTTFSQSVKEVKGAIESGVEQVQNRFDDILDQAEAIVNQDNNDDIGIILDLLNVTNQNLDQQGVTSVIHANIERTIHNIPVKLQPKVGIKGGLLLEDDLTPQYQIEQWYDIEILPLIEEAHQQLDTLTYNFRLALINITNRLELLQNKPAGFDIKDHLQPLERFQAGAVELKKILDDIALKIANKSESELSLSPLLNDDASFLSLGIQGSINRFRKEQNILIERFKYFWSLVKEKYFSIKSTVQEESQLGDVEKVIRYIRGASVDNRNVHYNNFFNAKVTMVEAFWIKRALEQKRIAQVVDSWNNGFQGAILLSGDRFSGKSSLGDWIGQQYFRGKTYSPKPGRALMISNKRVEFGNDLIGGIQEFIERVQYAKPLIWIDDLELWFNEDNPSDVVAENLLRLINEYSQKVFFVVSLGSWTHHRLRKLTSMDFTFQAIIELSPFTEDLIKDAILLRHGASHMTLVGKDGQELTSLEFDRSVGQITRQANGNIGHALQLWINGINFKDEQHVEAEELVKYKFPNIINSDNGILLTTLLIYRKIKEKDLGNLLGPAYEDKFKLQIARLVGYGVIKKAYNGTLSLNDRVIPAITELLKQNKFI